MFIRSLDMDCWAQMFQMTSRENIWHSSVSSAGYRISNRTLSFTKFSQKCSLHHSTLFFFFRFSCSIDNYKDKVGDWERRDLILVDQVVEVCAEHHEAVGVLAVTHEETITLLSAPPNRLKAQDLEDGIIHLLSRVDLSQSTICENHHCWLHLTFLAPGMAISLTLYGTTTVYDT